MPGGVKFESYALVRIRGAILDGLRAVDWVPRSVRQQARQLAEAMAQLEGRLGRPATDSEIQVALDISPKEYEELAAERGCNYPAIPRRALVRRRC